MATELRHTDGIWQKQPPSSVEEAPVPTEFKGSEGSVILTYLAMILWLGAIHFNLLVVLAAFLFLSLPQFFVYVCKHAWGYFPLTLHVEDIQAFDPNQAYVFVIGKGSRMVRELFVMAREHAPSIIFMDEIDSIGSARMESGSGNGDSEVQRTMLELLNQLDGFEASNKIKVLMATNRIDILDQALLIPGRIDRKIEFPNPNEESRWDILKIHSRKMNLMCGIDLKKIAEKMNGASGAELKAVCTEAGMFALRERRVHVTQEDFEMAVAKVMKKDTEKNMSLRKLWK